MLKSVLTCLAAGSLMASGTIGCSGSKVTDATSKREVSADGRTATQTRTRVRETGSGAVVRETEVQTREIVRDAPGTTRPTGETLQTDPTKRSGVVERD